MNDLFQSLFQNENLKKGQSVLNRTLNNNVF